MQEPNFFALAELLQNICNQNKSEQFLDYYLNIFMNLTTSPLPKADKETLKNADHTWQIRSAIMVMTMQSGFALLETGCVSSKSITNIMIKNIVDVALGGLCYWVAGYALSFGAPSTPVLGLGNFFLWDIKEENMGTIYTDYFFQFTFATTATTIASGALAERIRLHAYMMLSFMNTLSYCVPVAWIWNKHGFLKQLGFYDAAGGFAVHGKGGVAALVACIMLGPRTNRFKNPEHFQMSSPVTALAGTLMLWWAWFAYTCGSTQGTLGDSRKLWKLNALISCNTLNSSVGGCITGIIASIIQYSGRVDVTYVKNAILGSLVAISAICPVTSPLECLIIGAIGALLAIYCCSLVKWFKIDDPVGAISIHLAAGFWGTLAVGIFGKNDFLNILGRDGLFHGGGFYLLGVQLLGSFCITVWSALTTYCFVFIIDHTMGLRMSAKDELLGPDVVEHGIVKTDDLKGLTQIDEGDTVQINKEFTHEQLLILHRIGTIMQPQENPKVREYALKWRDKSRANLRRISSENNSSEVEKNSNELENNKNISINHSHDVQPPVMKMTVALSTIMENEETPPENTRGTTSNGYSIPMGEFSSPQNHNHNSRRNDSHMNTLEPQQEELNNIGKRKNWLSAQFSKED